MMDEQTITNAKVVLGEEIVHGSVSIIDSKISDLSQGNSLTADTVDFGGDYLLPGFVELHTDNLEKHFAPRPGVDWPGIPAALAHDAQLAAGGITTVYDAVCLGDLFKTSNRVRQLDQMSDAISHAQTLNIFRAEHHIHLRCELSFEGVLDLFDEHADHPLVGLVSLMDHTPGQRQFVNLDKYHEYYQKKYGMTEDELDEFAKRQVAAHDTFCDEHRSAVVERSKARGLPLASHDDATIAHVEEAVSLGAVIAEFPTTLEAARASHERGLSVLMGAPNLVLGGSHSGNVSAGSLAAEGLLDIISSDYVPTSMLQGVFVLAGDDVDVGLPQAVQKAAANPAQAANLNDRGEIAIGKRADLLRVSYSDEIPFVRSVWRKGMRVA